MIAINRFVGEVAATGIQGRSLRHVGRFYAMVLLTLVLPVGMTGFVAGPVWAWTAAIVGTALLLTPAYPVIRVMASDDPRSEPSSYLISQELAAFAQSIEGKEDRRRLFRRAIERLWQTYSHGQERSQWNVKLIHAADQACLPRWAVESLPSLYEPLSVAATSGQGQLLLRLFRRSQARPDRVLVWEYLREAIPLGYDYRCLRVLCGGVVVELELSDDARLFLEWGAPNFERMRHAIDLPSDRSMLGSATQAFIEIELLAGDQELATACANRRRHFLVDHRLAA